MSALENGYKVAVFNRQTSKTGQVPGVESVKGDRRLGLAPLDGRSFDVVVDTSGYSREWVRQSAKSLSGRVGAYVYISSANVYGPNTEPNKEDDGLRNPSNQLRHSDMTADHSPLAACERAVAEFFLGPSLIIRPSLLVGPHDPSDRLTYWGVRVAQGGRILAPIGAQYACQLLDVRDFSSWLVKMINLGESGIFNAATPAITFEDILNAAVRVVGGEFPSIVWADEQFLLVNRVLPWYEMPLWFPGVSPLSAPQISVSKAAGKGLHSRPLDETLTAGLRTFVREARPLAAGLSSERERALLSKVGSQ